MVACLKMSATTPPAAYSLPDLQGLHSPRPRHLPNGWGVEVVDVTPDLAAAMLLTNVEYNRNQRESLIAKYTADILEGRWRLTHQGVAFNVAGKLSDGQHRLEAVVRSGCTVRLVVWYGAGDRAEMAVVDTGGGRNATEAAKTQGLSLNAHTAATLRHMAKFGTPGVRVFDRPLTNPEVIALAERHAGVLAWLDEHLGRSKTSKRLSSAPLKAALALAYYHVERDRLARFVSVLIDVTPATEPGDGTAKHLRHWLVGFEGNPRKRGGPEGLDLFLRACRAVQLFFEGTDTSKLYAAPTNPFPLPA